VVWNKPGDSLGIYVVDWSKLSAFWIIFWFLYLYTGAKVLYGVITHSLLDTGYNKMFENYPLGVLVLLAILEQGFWVVINYGMATLLVNWLGLS
jgi:hypothetical protein